MTEPKPLEVADKRDKTWQQTKSENTRAAILEAALACFYDLGYGATTTEKVAKQAGVSRGAMLHHFPSRQHLVLEAVRHIYSKRLQIFKERELKVNEGAEHTRISEGIDAYWQQLQSPLFTVFHELSVAARTDDDLREAMALNHENLDESWRKVAESLFPDLAQSEDFETANLLTVCLLEGMVSRGITTGNIPDKLIPLLKRQLSEMFADVRNVGRSTVKIEMTDE
ncbi:MAG: TetR/AcrR family transcriptional regulator [Gammaproteobacteria bacterium]|jgi:AcrR family transcriptional regulator|nr:TetR/AcrR family transcriptional regulator [Gammaproteobacteria bacterium]MBT6572470.1 TetR/AcrR family transcriptional regulator [Gammaproteobacteria bacterium]MBT7533596.1 TetR/AcrR family transcriptional regulator [Gammaproteobacteria bacterium]MBT7877857.1 TetR/AcrR family transcriptional regulator [Gammaproteobacteria bacterium]MDG1233457.1 TetR/AcrR family transcriptional regulator [Pseudomonadales bacterium]